MPRDVPNPDPQIGPCLGLWDAVSIIIGIVIGTSIFRTAPVIFQNVPSPDWAMWLWVIGGFVSWCGAVCYAELATTYPRDGGDYVYLARAFGKPVGFLFAWAQLTVIISGNIGVMAYAFADYALAILPGWQAHAVWLAISPVIVLTIVNLLGIVAGKTAQNVLSFLKVAGLVAIVIAGMWVGMGPQPVGGPVVVRSGTNIGLALVFVLYAFGGWIHAPYVAAQVRDQRRNLPRSLIFGIVGITLIYLAVNAAYLAALGFDGARDSKTPAADVMQLAAGAPGRTAVSILVMLSALAAINGMILTGARIYAVWGEDYPALRWLSAAGPREGPIWAILVQSAIAISLILLVGTQAGRDAFDAALHGIRMRGLPWQSYNGGFETLLAGTAPVYWGLCFLGGVAVFVLRAKNREIERPYSIRFYPLPPIVLCAACAYLLYASSAYAGWLMLIGIVPLAIGGIVGVAVPRVRAKKHP